MQNNVSVILFHIILNMKKTDTQINTKQNNNKNNNNKKKPPTKTAFSIISFRFHLFHLIQ